MILMLRKEWHLAEFFERILILHLRDVIRNCYIPIDERWKEVEGALQGDDALLLIWLRNLIHTYFEEHILEEFDMLGLQKCSKIICSITSQRSVDIMMLSELLLQLTFVLYLRIKESCVDDYTHFVAAKVLQTSFKIALDKSHSLLSLNMAIVVKGEHI